MPQLSLNGYTYPPSKTSGCNEFTNTHMILKNTNHKKKRGGGETGCQNNLTNGNQSQLS